MSKVVAKIPDGPDLESKFVELERLTKTLEEGKSSLEESVAIYARAIALQIEIQEIINAAERRIVQVVRQDGSVEDFSEHQGRTSR